MRGYELKINKKLVDQPMLDREIKKINFGLVKSGVDLDRVQIYGHVEGRMDVLTFVSFD